MPLPSKYHRLTEFLESSGKTVVELSFGDINRILGQPLPESARSRREWWANSGHPHAGAWTDAGYRVERSDLLHGVIRFVRGANPTRSDPAPSNGRPQVEGVPAEMVARSGRRSGWSVDSHLAALDAGFDRYLKVCSERTIFSGPSVYFYARTIDRLRSARKLVELSDDTDFQESVYATLTSWGMHRMGETVAAKLTEFAVFAGTLRKLIRDVADLGGLSITSLSDTDATSVTARLASLADMPGITASSAPLVANTKTLHFLLPDLVPPMDRTYTGRFFFGPSRGMLLPGSPSDNFVLMFTALRRIATKHATLLRSITGTSYICLGHSKGLDNAVIGYVLSHPKLFPRPGRKGRVTAE